MMSSRRIGPGCRAVKGFSAEIAACRPGEARLGLWPTRRRTVMPGTPSRSWSAISRGGEGVRPFPGSFSFFTGNGVPNYRF